MSKALTLDELSGRLDDASLPAETRLDAATEVMRRFFAAHDADLRRRLTDLEAEVAEIRRKRGLRN